MTQSVLQFISTECDRGRHGPLVDADPAIGDNAVNIDRHCSDCGRLVSTVSWTREAFDEAQAKQVRRSA